MYVCGCEHVHVCVRACMCMCEYVHVCVCVHACMSMYISMFMYVCVCVHMEARGQPWVSFLGILSTLFSETMSLTGTSDLPS